MRPTLLTIRDQTKTLREWALEPGAAKATTIHHRLLSGWTHERAVFDLAVNRGRPPKMGPKLPPKPRRRLVGVNRPSRAMTERYERPEVILAPCPRVPNPHPPCLGSFRSFPLEALELLRRCA